MKRSLIRDILPVLITLLLVSALLSGCTPAAEPPESETPAASGEVYEPEGPEISEAFSPQPILNNRFTLRYNPKSILNPITGTDANNLLVSSLMYETLFVLDENLNAVPVLCESFNTEDFIKYNLKIKPGIKMSDGSELSARDVAYSLGRATETGRFINRLKNIADITYENDSTITIILRKPNSRFIKLLDIPIIKYGSIDNRIPPGTGPYTMSGGEVARLIRFVGHRDFDKLPINAVYLRECGDLEMIEMFSDGQISLIKDDPGGASDIYINRLHETRYFHTTALQYIGFNTRTAALSDSEMRRAIGFAVERGYIVNTIMSGNALEAPVALSPVYSLYDSGWETASDGSAYEISAILSSIGLADTNNDTYLEYPLSGGIYQDFSIDFIVNRENKYKTEAANRIAHVLRRVGLNVTVRELTWKAFNEALESGDFDMYYGETALTADFNLEPLLTSGGNLNYSGIDGQIYSELIDEFLSAENENLEKEAAQRLCAEITQNAPIIPILYKKHAVHSVRGVVTGALPTQSNVFYKLTEWTIKPGGNRTGS